jgi:peptidoglycan/xylan/chitin deacetylase (PgdA/CDA1 family)
MPGHAWAEDQALVAITLDLEMSRNFPTWDQVHWDYHKGNLDKDTKAYAAEACRRVKARGGRVHCFAVGQVFEQDNLDWLRAIVRDGHPVGNHTYDHVNILARTPEELQFRFRRWPWLMMGRTPERVIRDQVRMTNQAIQSELRTTSAGFRSPGGFGRGLKERPDIQKMLLEEGFDWVSTQYAGVPALREGTKPTPDVFAAILRTQPACQPYQYESGLVEVPMSTISDIHAFRTARWKLPDFLKAIEIALDWVIERKAVFDFLAHPSCLAVTDPEFKAVELICAKVQAARPRAELVDLATIARRVQSKHQRGPA